MFVIFFNRPTVLLCRSPRTVVQQRRSSHRSSSPRGWEEAGRSRGGGRLDDDPVESQDGVPNLEVRGAPVTSTHWMGPFSPPRTCDPWFPFLLTLSEDLSLLFSFNTFT